MGGPDPLILRLPPYDYQAKGIEFAYAKKYSLNGDKPGLGKTLQALGLAALSGVRRVLVICPAILVFNWKDEIRKFLGEDVFDRFNVISYDSLGKVQTLEGFGLVIADEVHAFKNLEAIRTQRLHALMQKNPPEYFIGLSGTPVKNAVPEFYSLLKLCWYGGGYPEFDMYARSPYGFNHSFTTKKSLFFGGRHITKFEGVRNVEKLKALIKPVYIRRRAEEVLSLPEKVYREVLISDKASFDETTREAWENYLGGKNRNLFASNKAVSALAKVKFTADFVRGLLEEVDRVIVFTDHVQAAREIFQSFPVGDSRVIVGETPMGERAETIRAFEAGRVKVLVATISTMSVGVNLTSCSDTIFNDAPWVPADMLQAESRTMRLGQRKVCRYYYILASRIDQKIYRTLAAKKNLLQKLDV